MNGCGKAAPLSLVFYVEIAFICITFILSGWSLMLKNAAVFIWLPSVLILCSILCSLSSLMYLNRGVALRSQNSLLMYMLITLILIIFRLFCFCVLIFGLFTHHPRPTIVKVLLIVTMLHVLFDLIAIARTTTVRENMSKWNTKDRRRAPVEEIAVVNLPNRQTSLSQTTLVTNLDEDLLIR